ncbi:MAG: hypothetical protein CK548_02795 [Opitutia bacterium]|nr:MAG: hypothetical protein CK548_02795 [Opitutae bacterium]
MKVVAQAAKRSKFGVLIIEFPYQPSLGFRSSATTNRTFGRVLAPAAAQQTNIRRAAREVRGFI